MSVHTPDSPGLQRRCEIVDVRPAFAGSPVAQCIRLDAYRCESMRLDASRMTAVPARPTVIHHPSAAERDRAFGPRPEAQPLYPQVPGRGFSPAPGVIVRPSYPLRRGKRRAGPGYRHPYQTIPYSSGMETAPHEIPSVRHHFERVTV